MFKIIATTVTILLINISTKAITVTNSYLGVATMTEQVNEVQTSGDGSKNSFELNPGILAGIALPLNNSSTLNFCPEIGVLLPRHTEGGDITRSSYFFWSNLSYDISDWTLRAGLGINYTRISSTGGTKSLGNGNSSSTFYLPQYAETANNFVIQAGIEYFFSRSFSSRIDGVTLGVGDSDKRAFSYMISILYHINPQTFYMGGR